MSSGRKISGRFGAVIRIGKPPGHQPSLGKFWLEPEGEPATQTGLAKHVIGEAQQLVEDHRQEIIDAWNKYFPG